MKTVGEKHLRIPRRRKTSHKGENGSVLIIGGSPEYPGAVALAGLAALRAGSDLVRIAAPENVAWVVNCISPDLITIKFKGDRLTGRHLKTLLKEAERADAVLVGNGLGKVKWVRKFVRDCRKPLVIDADAVKALSINDCEGALFTPHHKEFEILCENSGVTGNMLRKKLGSNVVLLKGAEDRIMSATAEWKNTTGNPGMTKGGTGDVLAGLAVGFLSQGLSLTQSAINAAFINGRVGDRLAKKKGYSFIASDIVTDWNRIKNNGQHIF